MRGSLHESPMREHSHKAMHSVATLVIGLAASRQIQLPRVTAAG